MRRVIVAFIIAIILVVPISFWVGVVWNLTAQKATAMEHAVWIARHWDEDKSISTIIDEIARDGGIHIFQDEWILGDEPYAALGPVVSDKRICVMRDRSIQFRPAQ
jgi:hypothetical protein